MNKEVDLKKLSDCDEEGIFRPEKLAMVHVTDYMPQKVGDHYEIQSTAQATDYRNLRNTIHFTVGHPVRSNSGGNWDEERIMIVAPMQGIIDKNGLPLGMSALDTYFETSPGHNLELPQGTHLFILTTDEKKLNGNLTYNDGDITYYKSSGFTDEDKEKIYLDWNISPERIRSSYKPFSESFEEVKSLPDDFFASKLKQMILMDYLKQEGYIQNYGGFERESSIYAENVKRLGKKLGCRFCSSGMNLHFNSDLSEIEPLREMTDLISYADLILHPDDYHITSRLFKSEYSVTCMFQKEGTTLGRSLLSYIDPEISNCIQKLKDGFDFTQELSEMEQEYGHKWTPAFRASYELWKKKTLERLKIYYKEAKGYDFEKAHQKLEKRMEAFDQHSEEPSPETPKQGKKASGLSSKIKEEMPQGVKRHMISSKKKTNG